MNYTTSALALLMALSISGYGLADEKRQHGTHEHGTGQLNLVQEGTTLDLELDSPAANIVGFEHRPETEDQHRALTEALTMLENSGQLFKLPSEAKCRLSDTEVTTPLQTSVVDEHHDEVGHDEHDEHHDEAGHDEHDHEHDTETHSDITAHYRFDCQQPDQLTQLTVGLFQAFPATEQLRVQFVTNGHQGSTDLDRSNNILTLQP